MQLNDRYVYQFVHTVAAWVHCDYLLGEITCTKRKYRHMRIITNMLQKQDSETSNRRILCVSATKTGARSICIYAASVPVFRMFRCLITARIFICFPVRSARYFLRYQTLLHASSSCLQHKRKTNAPMVGLDPATAW